jgi:hypothetical protein
MILFLQRTAPLSDSSLLSYYMIQGAKGQKSLCFRKKAFAHRIGNVKHLTESPKNSMYSLQISQRIRAILCVYQRKWASAPPHLSSELKKQIPRKLKEVKS